MMTPKYVYIADIKPSCSRVPHEEACHARQKTDRIRPVPEMYKWYQVVSSGIIEAEVSSGRQVIFPKPIFSHRVEHQMDSNGGRVRQLSGHSHGMKLKDAVL